MCRVRLPVGQGRASMTRIVPSSFISALITSPFAPGSLALVAQTVDQQREWKAILIAFRAPSGRPEGLRRAGKALAGPKWVAPDGSPVVGLSTLCDKRPRRRMFLPTPFHFIPPITLGSCRRCLCSPACIRSLPCMGHVDGSLPTRSGREQ